MPTPTADMLAAPGAGAELLPHACCSALRVLHSPNRGTFGYPTVNVLGEYAAVEGGDGAMRCTSGCGDTNVTLKQVRESFMGGTRWAFLSEAKQYVAFGTIGSACAEDVHAWKYWQVNRYLEGQFRMECAPVDEAERCCDELHVYHAPSRGVFGSPSASLLGRYAWSSGGYDCADCDANVTLEPVSEAWMGGTRWTFITHGKQYPVFAASDIACPAAVPLWKFWHISTTSEYREGSFFLQCGGRAGCCSKLRVTDAPLGGVFGHPASTVLGTYTWSQGKYDCADCDAPITLEPVRETWMGGTRWTFITHGTQYVAFGAAQQNCPLDVGTWKYWNAGQGYTRGTIKIECDDDAATEKSLDSKSEL